MKRIFTILTLVGLFVSTASQAQDTKAKSIMDKVSTKLKDASGISANFSLKALNSQGQAQMTQSGTLAMKGNQYRIHLNSGQEMICDGHSVWTYMPKNKEVQVMSYSPESMAISPSQLLSGSYGKEFNFKYSGRKNVSGKSVAVVTLNPKDKGKSFSKVDLYINTDANMIAGGKVYASGAIYEYSISDVKTDAALNNSTFKFNTKHHPGVEVVDLR